MERRGMLGGLLAVALLAATLGGSSSGDATEDLYGTWRSSSSGQTWEISEGSIAVTGGAGDGFTFNLRDTTILLIDEPGPRACPPSRAGSYEWVIEGDVLSLTAVSDPCEGRRNFLDGFTLERGE